MQKALFSAASALALAGSLACADAGERDAASLGLAPPQLDVERDGFPAGAIAPSSDDRVLFDTRGTLQSRRDVREALALFDDGHAGHWLFSTNFDGSGTNALVLPWRGAGGRCRSEWKLLVQTLPKPRPRRLFLQWKSRLGRTVMGGGVGEVGGFDISPNDCGEGGGDRVRFLRDVRGEGAKNSFGLVWTGSTDATSQHFAGEAFDPDERIAQNRGSDFHPSRHANQTITTTIYVQAASGPDEDDGVLALWQDGELRLLRRDVRLGSEAFDRFQFPELMRHTAREMTEYWWDVVAWEPAEALSPDAPDAPDDGGSAPVPPSGGGAPVPPATPGGGAPVPPATPGGGAPTPAPAPTPTPAPQPAPSPGSYVAALSDDFSGYGSTSALRANMGAKRLYTWTISPELAQLDREVTYRGHPTLRYVQPAGTSRSPQLTVQLPTAMSSVWLRIKVRFMPGWTTAGVTGSAARAYKIAGGGWKSMEGRLSLEYTDTDRYTYSLTVKDPKSGKLKAYKELAGGRVGGEWRDGGWYDLILHYERSGPASARARFWIARDGERPVLRSEVATTIDGPAQLIDRVLLGMNFNQQRGPAQSQYLNYGAWEVVDGSQYPNPFRLQ
jgi:hypothetical protein